MVDLVHIGEVVVGAHAVLGHHAAHAGAVAAIIILLDPARFVRRDPEKGTDEFPDPGVDLLPQIDVMRIQRVVEIEHPGADMGKGAGRGFHAVTNLPVVPCVRRDDETHHGIAKCRVLPPPDMSTVAKPVTARPRVPQSLCSLISNLLSRVQSSLAPPQFSGRSLSLTVRLSPSTASAKLKICRGWPLI